MTEMKIRVYRRNGCWLIDWGQDETTGDRCVSTVLTWEQALARAVRIADAERRGATA